MIFFWIHCRFNPESAQTFHIFTSWCSDISRPALSDCRFRIEESLCREILKFHNSPSKFVSNPKYFLFCHEVKVGNVWKVNLSVVESFVKPGRGPLYAAQRRVSVTTSRQINLFPAPSQQCVVRMINQCRCLRIHGSLGSEPPILLCSEKHSNRQISFKKFTTVHCMLEWQGRKWLHCHHNWSSLDFLFWVKYETWQSACNV